MSKEEREPRRGKTLPGATRVEIVTGVSRSKTSLVQANARPRGGPATTGVMSGRRKPMWQTQRAEVLSTLRRSMLGFEPPKPAVASLFTQVTGFQGTFRGLDVSAVSKLPTLGLAEEINRTLKPSVAYDFTKALGAYSALEATRGKLTLGSDFAHMSERMGRLLQAQLTGKSFIEALQPLRGVGLATQRWIALQQEIDEQSDAFVKRHAWPIPLSISVGAYRQIVGMADRGKREVTAFMKRAFRPEGRAYRRAIERLLSSDHFASRRPLLRQAVRAHGRGEWYLAINAVLPSVEGVLLDVTYPEGAAKGVGARQGVQRLKTASAADATAEAIETILLSAGANTALFESFDRSRYGRKGEPRSLNRHAILHGAARRYGTAENSLRLLLLLVVMAEVFDIYESDLAGAAQASSSA